MLPLFRSEQIPVTSSGIEFVPQMGSRRFRNLNKDHLQMEDEDNARLMTLKMFKNDNGLWVCKDCKKEIKFDLKAKSHARTCGQRQKKIKKKKSGKKFVKHHLDQNQLFLHTTG